ncbi:MAG: TRAP transporter small permease [Maritimibacter sp.]|nr:TRAP transporter small permease [Maritimibacter sp.]
MRRVLNAIDRVFTLATAIAFSSALIAVALTVADVVLRAASSLVGLATGQRAPWAVPGLVDLNQLAIMTCAALAIAVAFYRGGHVGVDVVTELMPSRLRRGFSGLASGLGALLCLGMAWAGAREMLGQIAFPTKSATLGIAFTWYWAPLLAGLALSALGAATAGLRRLAEGEERSHV